MTQVLQKPAVARSLHFLVRSVVANRLLWGKMTLIIIGKCGLKRLPPFMKVMKRVMMKLCAIILIQLHFVVSAIFIIINQREEIPTHPLYSFI